MWCAVSWLGCFVIIAALAVYIWEREGEEGGRERERGKGEG